MSEVGPERFPAIGEQAMTHQQREVLAEVRAWPRLNELAILVTARHWTAQFEWYAHSRLAREAGLDETIITAIREHKRPDGMKEPEAAVYDFAHALLKTGSVDDAPFNSVTRLFGERGVMDLVGGIGYYSLVSMILNVDRTPLPPGETLPLLR